MLFIFQSTHTPPLSLPPSLPLSLPLSLPPRLYHCIAYSLIAKVLSIYLSIYLSVYLFVSLSVCLSSHVLFPASSCFPAPPPLCQICQRPPAGSDRLSGGPGRDPQEENGKHHTTHTALYTALYTVLYTLSFVIPHHTLRAAPHCRTGHDTTYHRTVYTILHTMQHSPRTLPITLSHSHHTAQYITHTPCDTMHCITSHHITSCMPRHSMQIIRQYRHVFLSLFWALD